MTSQSPWLARSFSSWLSPWVVSVALGLWLSLTAVWPVATIQVKFAHFLWQPLLILSLLILVVIWSRRYGWGVAAAQGLWIYVVFSVAGWLPFLRTTSYWTYYPYPRVYGLYLYTYEVGIAALIGYLAFRALSRRFPSWWNADGWNSPLVMAPVLLMVRGVQVGYWLTPLIGIAFGVILAALWPRRWAFRILSERLWRLVPLGVFLIGALLVFGSGLRIYMVTGSNFPAASDDGPSYYQMAVSMAGDPGLFWTPRLGDENYFTGYYPAMALWFMVAGSHIPYWLLWHGMAGGLLAVTAYCLGRALGGRVCGLLAAGLVVADRVTLHLMATMNMETFFLPALYLSILFWSTAGERPLEQQWTFSFLAGVSMGAATIFRPTSVLLPIIFIALLLWEHPRMPLRSRAAQGGWMLGGFVLPVSLLVFRHRIAWGYWTLSGVKGIVSSLQNYALVVQGQHPAEIGLWPWLRLVAADPVVIWRSVIPGWWEQLLSLWTHQGFGQMDLIQGLNHVGPYQAALACIWVLGIIVGLGVALRRRTRRDLVLVALLVYFSSLVLAYYVLNSRYRAPFIPALYLLCCQGFFAAATIQRRA